MRPVWWKPVRSAAAPATVGVERLAEATDFRVGKAAWVGEAPARRPAVMRIGQSCRRGGKGELMNSHSVTLDSGAVRSVPRAETLKAALVAAVLGLGLVFLTGFAHSMVLHNGAHDTRHALSFPCH